MNYYKVKAAHTEINIIQIKSKNKGDFYFGSAFEILIEALKNTSSTFIYP